MSGKKGMSEVEEEEVLDQRGGISWQSRNVG